jgi:hypothetical protein
MVFIPKTDAHPCDKTHNLFESALTFCYKPPLGASSPFTSAVFALTFRALPFTLGGISVDFSL